MDCPALTAKKEDNEVGIIAFLGSVNFTSSAFHQNYEFLLKTTDINFTKELIKYFNDFYNSDELTTLTKNEIFKELDDKKMFDYPKEIL